MKYLINMMENVTISKDKPTKTKINKIKRKLFDDNFNNIKKFRVELEENNNDDDSYGFYDGFEDDYELDFHEEIQKDSYNQLIQEYTNETLHEIIITINDNSDNLWEENNYDDKLYRDI